MAVMPGTLLVLLGRGQPDLQTVHRKSVFLERLWRALDMGNVDYRDPMLPTFWAAEHDLLARDVLPTLTGIAQDVALTATATGFTGVQLTGINYDTDTNTNDSALYYTSGLDTFKTADVSMGVH